MNKNVNSILAITIIIFFAIIMAALIYLLGKNIDQQVSQSQIIEQKDINRTTKNSGIWKKYISNWSLSFEYPTQDCDYVSGGRTTGECHDVILSRVSEGFSIGTLIREKIKGNINEYIRPNVILYYKQDLLDLQDEKGVDEYLKSIFNNECFVDSWRTYKGIQIKKAVLSSGCRPGMDPSSYKVLKKDLGQ